MKNPDLPCMEGWDPPPCRDVDGERCPVHSHCQYGCGDAGYVYGDFTEEELLEPHPAEDEAFWEAHKLPCKCQLSGELSGTEPCTSS